MSTTSTTTLFHFAAGDECEFADIPFYGMFYWDQHLYLKVDNDAGIVLSDVYVPIDTIIFKDDEKVLDCDVKMQAHILENS